MQLLCVTPNCCKGSTFCPPKGNNVKKAQNPVPKRHDKVKFLKSLAPPLMAALLTLSPIGYIPDSLGQTIDVQRGASLFRKACIGCHDGGGNIIQPGATLFLKDLQRNGIDSEEEIYRVTYFGKGRMPGFGENCTPKGQCTFGARLLDDEIKLLAEFVKLQADQGWPNIKLDED
ncbi:cytochrome c6, chloroplastic isoform X1 [Morus notabilis]|uniref:cytochrome c6, chloroplastic isoform X1 n=2 Tax=Morus notabilis TaxID=981085 RepID=UPI000CECEE03|nr:cytochrome c6, chloroplastic isoform X1 [Morus notabilis]